MKKQSLFFGLLILLMSLQAQAVDLCQVIRAAKSGQFTGSELCEAYNASFCSGISLSTAICQIGGGSFCSSVKDDIQAVCHVQNGSFCSSLSSQDKLKYFNYIDNCLRN